MRLPIQSMQAIRICDPGTGEWFRSVIVDYEPDRELVVLLPGEKDRDFSGDGDLTVSGQASKGAPDRSDDFLDPPPFNKGAPVRVEVSLPDGIRQFDSVVRRLELTYGGSLRIEWPTVGTRIQRRDFVRVEVTFQVVVHFIDEERVLHQKEAVTLDFSAGGLRLRMLQPLPAELRLDLEVNVPALQSIVLRGSVIRSGEIERKRADRPQFYWVAVEFVGLDATLRKELTQLVFDIQREQMRKRYEDRR